MMRVPHTPEARALISERLKAYWADPEKRAKQSEHTRDRMNRPEVRRRIADGTRAALADPATRQRQFDGLTRVWADPAKREQQATLTRERMAQWRAGRLEAAAVVLRQLPRAERAAAMAKLASAAHGASTR